MTMWAFRVFSDPVFYFYFQFFIYADLNKNPKRDVLKPLPSTSSSYELGQWRFFWGLFG